MSGTSPPTEDRTVEDQRGGPDRNDTVTRSYLFVMLECDRLLAGGARYALDGIDEVVIGRGPTRGVRRDQHDGRNRLLLRLPGPALSAQHARLLRAGGGWILEDSGSTNGSYVNSERVTTRPLALDDIVEVGRSFLAIRTVQVPEGTAPLDVDSTDAASRAVPPGFSTLDPVLAHRLDDLRRIALSPITVVLCGETGTGKELIARSLHALSRPRGPFVAVNCGALTRGLAESQLFGHVKGSFSGAIADSPGFVRAAAGGTLLLDEVPDLDPAVQVSLLRVLQEREVVPVGAARPQPVDVRVIAATPAPLSDLVRTGRFRADLFARLAGFTFVTPTLRDRRVDAGVLVAALLTKMDISASDNVRFAPEVGWAILRHPWPLNIRSLEQLLLRSRVLARDGLITAACAQFPDAAELSHTATAFQPGASDVAPAAGAWQPVGPAALSPADLLLMGELQRELAAAHGNVAEVARQRGMARMQVYRWLRRFGIDAAGFRVERH